MAINTQIIQEFKNTDSRLLAVTKYFDKNTTEDYIEQLEKYSGIIYGYGENRLESIESKNISRDSCHFIGNIQSRKIKNIISSCSVIHSVSNKKHLLLCKKMAKEKKQKLKIFLQLNLDREKNIGFSSEEIIELLKQNEYTSEYFQIIGISGMGAGVFEEDEKRAEFQKLIDIRDKFLPSGLISAGTSRDYRIALDMEIDVIRIGSALFKQ